MTDIQVKLYAGVQQVLFVSQVTCNQEIDTQRMKHCKATGHRFVETFDESGSRFSRSSSKVGGSAVDIMSQSQSKLTK